MKYYKNNNGYIATIGTLALPEITEEEFNAEMSRIEAVIEKQAKNYAPMPTETERLEALEQAFMEFVEVMVNG